MPTSSQPSSVAAHSLPARQQLNLLQLLYQFLFGPRAVATPMSRLCEIVYPIASGMELKYSEMTAAQKYQCMHVTLQILTVFTNITQRVNANGIDGDFYNFGNQLISFTKVPTDHGYWEKDVLLKVPGMYDHFVKDVCAELKVPLESEEATKIEARCFRFAELYGSKLALSLEDIIGILRRMKFYMSEEKILGKWDRILPSLLECNAKVFNIFWSEAYEPGKFLTETQKQLLNYAVDAGILDHSMISRARVASDASSVSIESEDPTNGLGSPIARSAVTYYEVPILPPAQTKVFIDPMPHSPSVTSPSAVVIHSASSCLVHNAFVPSTRVGATISAVEPALA